MMNPPLIALFDCRQGNVRQKRRDHATLGRAVVSGQKEAFCQHTGLQELPNHTRHPEIADTRANSLHQQVMINVIKAALDVALDDPLIRRALASAITGLRSRTYRHADMLQSPVTASSRSKPIRDVPERGLEDRLQQVLDRPLHEAVGDSGNAQGSELPRFTRLWNPLPAARARLIPSRSQVVTKPLQESLASHPRANAFHRLPVNSGSPSAFVRGDLPPRTSQVARVSDPVPQLSIAAAGICFTPLIELALNAQEPDLIGLIIRVHGWFLRHRKLRRFPACLCPVHGFPVLRLLRRLRPPNQPKPDLRGLLELPELGDMAHQSPRRLLRRPPDLRCHQ